MFVGNCFLEMTSRPACARCVADTLPEDGIGDDQILHCRHQDQYRTECPALCKIIQMGAAFEGMYGTERRAGAKHMVAATATRTYSM